MLTTPPFIESSIWWDALLNNQNHQPINAERCGGVEQSPNGLVPGRGGVINSPPS